MRSSRQHLIAMELQNNPNLLALRRMTPMHQPQGKVTSTLSIHFLVFTVTTQKFKISYILICPLAHQWALMFNDSRTGPLVDEFYLNSRREIHALALINHSRGSLDLLLPSSLIPFSISFI